MKILGQPLLNRYYLLLSNLYDAIMMKLICSRRKAVATLCMAVTFAAAITVESSAQTPSPVLRIRGSIVSVSPTNLVVKERSGEVLDLVLTEKSVVSEVYPIKLEDIKPGSYIGAAATPQADGTQRAIAISVFSEAARGTAEGHRPFDLLPESTMTNATVDDVGMAGSATDAGGRTLKLKYKDGEKTIQVPANTPIVTSRPGDRSLLLVGASVSLAAQAIDSKPTALRINVGKNGFALPY